MKFKLDNQPTTLMRIDRPRRNDSGSDPEPKRGRLLKLGAATMVASWLPGRATATYFFAKMRSRRASAVLTDRARKTTPNSAGD
ncbi:MAG: hypothetical protein WA628_15550 [Terriglobales bacterium]